MGVLGDGVLGGIIPCILSIIISLHFPLAPSLESPPPALVPQRVHCSHLALFLGGSSNFVSTPGTLFVFRVQKAS